MPDYRFIGTPAEIVGTRPDVSVAHVESGDSMIFGYGLDGPMAFDPYLLKLYKVIQAGLILVVGKIGSGKSFGIKHLLVLLFVLQRANGTAFRFGAADLKRYEEESDVADVALPGQAEIAPRQSGGEYGPFARWAGCRVLDYVNAALNILDPGLGLTLAQQHALLVLIVTQLRGIEAGLPRYWETALETGLRILRDLPASQQTYHNLITIINQSPVDDQGKPNEYWPILNGRKQRISPIDEYAQATSELSDVMKRLEGGVYGNIFYNQELDGYKQLDENGETVDTPPLSELLNQRVVVGNYAPLDDIAIAMLYMIETVIKAAAMENRNRSFEVHISVSDEAHRLWGIPGVARSKAYEIKTIRALGYLMIMLSQRISDLYAAGSLFAENAVDDFNAVLAFRLPHKEALLLQKRYDLSDKVTKLIENLEPETGQCVLLIQGEEPEYMVIPETPLIKELGETDQAARANVGSLAPMEGVAL